MSNKESPPPDLLAYDTEVSNNGSPEPSDNESPQRSDNESSQRSDNGIEDEGDSAEGSEEGEEDEEDEEGSNGQSDENMDSDSPVADAASSTVDAPGGPISMIPLPEEKPYPFEGIGIHPNQGGIPGQGQPIVGKPGQSLHLLYPSQAVPDRGEPYLEPPKSKEGKYRSGLEDAPHLRATPPRDIDISLVEIATFCPHWFQVPDVTVRAITNGLSRQGLAKLENHARGQNTAFYHKKASDRIQQQYSFGGKQYYNLEPGARWLAAKELIKDAKFDDLTANRWDLRESYVKGTTKSPWDHVLLIDLLKGVRNRPPAKHRGLMTACILYAEQHPHLRLDTSHWRLIIHAQGWAIPPKQNHSWDDAAIAYAKSITNPT